ncbi:hypothetical protein [Brevibacillus reuszeri]|uniref:hypothetical protein n=1 Tax=Brevibacillus reuszeri TaxID=54915 RepID=UPI003D210C6C
MTPKVKRTSMIIGMIIGMIMLIGFGNIFFKYVIQPPTRDFVPGDHRQTHVVSPSYLKTGKADVGIIVVD